MRDISNGALIDAHNNLVRSGELKARIRIAAKIVAARVAQEPASDSNPEGMRSARYQLAMRVLSNLTDLMVEQISLNVAGVFLDRKEEGSITDNELAECLYTSWTLLSSFDPLAQR